MNTRWTHLRQLAAASPYNKNKMKDLPIIKLIIETVCDIYNITPEDLHLKTRKRRISLPRQICMSLIYDVAPQLQKSKAAEIFGLNHCNVYQTKIAVKNQMDTDAKFRERIELIREIIKTK